MSYSRFPVYAWSDGHSMHLWVRLDADAKDCRMQQDPDDYEIAGGVNISEKLFDQLALLVVAELVNEPRRLKRALKRLRSRGNPFRGNFGSYPFFKLLGEDPAAELKKRLEEHAR